MPSDRGKSGRRGRKLRYPPSLLHSHLVTLDELPQDFVDKLKANIIFAYRQACRKEEISPISANQMEVNITATAAGIRVDLFKKDEDQRRSLPSL